MSPVKELRDIATMGIATDPAIGADVGPALTAIASSLVDGVFRPRTISSPGRRDPSSLFVVPSNPNSVAVSVVALAARAGAATLTIGLFINAVVTFAIVALVSFLVEGINAVGISKPRLRPLNV